MALFDSTLLFFHATGTYQFTSGEFVNLTGATASSTSTVVNLGNARDLGIGPGHEIPQVVAVVGTAITSSSSTMTINLQFQGSTNSVLWTTYSETGASTTASWAAGSQIVFDVPRRPPGAGLPLYYQLNLAGSNTVGGSPSISTGTILAGIVLAAAESAGTMALYPAGFTVA